MRRRRRRFRQKSNMASSFQLQYNRRSGRAPLKLSGCRFQTLAVDCSEVGEIHVTIVMVDEHPYVPGPIIEILRYSLDTM